MPRQLRIEYPGAVYHILARAIHALTSVSQVWMAERLKMKSAANVSQQLRRLKRGELKLDRNVKEWLARTV